MGDFVVGDKIKGKDNNYDVTNKDMTLAEVTKTYDDGEMDIYIINHANEREEGSTYSVDNNADKFELVQPALSFEFKIDNDLYEKAILGIWKNDTYIKKEEENEMSNKVLELWYDRETKKIGEKYDEIVNKKVKETYSVVESYNELIKNFNNDLEDLFKYDNANEQFVLKENNSCNVFKYVVDYDRLEETARKEIQEDFNKDSRELNDKYKEINALLSMSEDLEYQQSILIEYKIIDKKTKRMI